MVRDAGPVDTRDGVHEALTALGVTSSARSASALALELGRLYRDLGQLDLALRSYVTALELQGRTGDVSDLCRAQAGIVTVRALRGDVSDAAETLLEVRRLARANGLDAAEAEIEAASALVERVSRGGAVPRRDSTAAARTLDLVLLGTLEVNLDGRTISARSWRTAKAKELFALLVLAGDRSAARDELIEMLWPDSDPASGVSNFHFTLHCLRKALAPAGGPNGPVVRTGQSYRLELAATIVSDMEEFERLARRATDLRRTGLPDEAAEALRAAVGLYRGEFMAGMDAGWIDERRAAIERRHLSACRQLAEIEMERRRPEAAIAAAERYLAREPYDEAIHRVLLRAHHGAGDIAGMSAHYAKLVALLDEDLHEAPEGATRQLFEQLRGTGRSSSSSRPELKLRPALLSVR